MRFTAFCACAILYLHVCTDAVTVGSNSTEEVQDASIENDSDMEDYSEDQNVTGVRHDVVANSSLLLKMATPCQTPNNDEGFCVGIRECSILYNQLDNKLARKFLQASMCGPGNEQASNPKVCCGGYNNYKKANPLKHNGNNKKSGKVLTRKCGRQKRITRSRILGGTTAALGEFPWMARLIRKKKNFKSFGCGGFLITQKFVMTAAHCASNNNVTGSLYEVVFGEHDTTTVIDCSPGRKECALPLQIRRVAVVIVHPEYDSKALGYYNDIALIRLKRRVQITEYVRPICLLSDSNASPYKYTVSGWGSTEKDSLSTVKMKVDLLSVKRSSCQSMWSIFNIQVKDTQRCAGGDGKTDTCRGDSGGPLMMTHDGSVWFAAGIVSYGLGCGIKEWPGIYTNIPSYLPWIMEQKLLHKKKRV